MTHNMFKNPNFKKPKNYKIKNYELKITKFGFQNGQESQATTAAANGLHVRRMTSEVVMIAIVCHCLCCPLLGHSSTGIFPIWHG
jgi:hypothetical protein